MNVLLLLTSALVAQPGDTPLRFHETKDSQQIIATLPAARAAKLPAGRLTQDAGESILSVSLLRDDTKKPGPAMLGKYERDARALTFTPRFSFEAGQTYRAVLKLDGESFTVDHRVPELKNQTAPKVVKIYPTSDVLPANHLKFYIYFDRPMRGGKELFDRIVLIDDKGKVIDDAWLFEEIWIESENCLIIYIHPGRIKWGVELRELLGPVLYEKRNYSLVVRGELTDLKGNKIGNDVVKKFRTTPEDRVRIDLSKWDLLPARAGTKESLVLTAPKSIDHRSLKNFLKVTDVKGQVMEGHITLGKEEKTWYFAPSLHWREATYHLDVDARLEDVAGNTPADPFDRDLTAPKLPAQKLRFEFQSK